MSSTPASPPREALIDHVLAVAHQIGRSGTLASESGHLAHAPAVGVGVPSHPARCVLAEHSIERCFP